MTKAVFFDIDGTLLSFQTHRITTAVQEALYTLRAKGIKLFIATGRHWQMLPYIRSVFSFDGFVTLNGQYCFCGDRVVRSCPMDPQAAREVVEATRNGAFPCIYLEKQELYINQVNDHVRAFMDQLDLALPPIHQPEDTGELYQAIVFLTKEKERLLLDRAPNVNAARWHPYFMDIIPPDGGKHRGIDAILKEFHISLEDTMAFGDGENDLTMLKHVGTGVAMGSASDFVKGQADYVTGTVEEDGIITALTQFGLL